MRRLARALTRAAFALVLVGIVAAYALIAYMILGGLLALEIAP